MSNHNVQVTTIVTMGTRLGQLIRYIFGSTIGNQRRGVPPPYTIEEIDELEWDNIVSRPSAQRGLSRHAVEIRRQIAAGEIEEGGFAVE